jgi:hypothetical protein
VWVRGSCGAQVASYEFTTLTLGHPGWLELGCARVRVWVRGSCGAQVASYEFTTLTCIPGVVRYRGAKIQLLDLPGIIEGAKDGKGRGRQARPPPAPPPPQYAGSAGRAGAVWRRTESQTGRVPRVTRRERGRGREDGRGTAWLDAVCCHA